MVGIRTIIYKETSQYKNIKFNKLLVTFNTYLHYIFRKNKISVYLSNNTFRGINILS